MSSTGQNNAARRMIASLVVAAALVASSSSAHAVIVGGVTISGTRWVNGVPSKVKCSASDGNMLDATAYGVRDFTIQNTPGCAIWNDTDNGDHFKFEGRERHIIKNGVPMPVLSFSGEQTASGPGVSDPAHGAATGYLKCANNVCQSEKGTITYSRVNSNNATIIFIGTFKASF